MPDERKSKHSLWQVIAGFFHKKKALDNVSHHDLKNIEPKYWPEVRKFIEDLHTVIEQHTIQDDNIKTVNDRIVEYILEEINKKGQIKDIESRYDALETLSDRVLSHYINRLVGLKTAEKYNTDFTDMINLFKHNLSVRKQAELDAESKQ